MVSKGVIWLRAFGFRAEVRIPKRGGGCCLRVQDFSGLEPWG